MAELNTQSRNQNSGRAYSKSLSPRVDMTPMVDLMFLLITFFMLTTSLGKQYIMQLAMPVGDDPGQIADNRTMTICLGKNDKLDWYMGNEAKPLTSPMLASFDNEGLRKILADTKESVFKTTGKGLFVIIKPAQKSTYKNLVDVLDELKIQELDAYSIVDISETDVSRMKSENIY